MTGLKKFKIALTIGTALALAACDGPVNVASPGEAVLSGGGGGTGGSGSGGSGGGGSGGTAAGNCPTGFTDLGTIVGGTLRNCLIPSLITGDVTVPLRTGTVYSLSGRVDVGIDRKGDFAAPVGTQGILRIDAGVKIFGLSGTGLDYLVINRGSQIFAVGTATQPIIFTSKQNLEGTAGIDSFGQWGGIVILGRAFIANCPGATAADQASLYSTAACENEVEGTAADYGGNSNTDNSGVLRYVRVLFAGFEVLPNVELNGITFGGVGSGTTVDHIQVHNNADDCVEFFGGVVSIKHLVCSGNDDDNFDTDQGYRGSIQFALILQAPARGNHWFEASLAANAAVNAAPAATTAPLPNREQRRSNPIVANFTIVGSNTSPQANRSLLNTGTAYRAYNGVAVSTKAGTTCLDMDNAVETGTQAIFRSVVLSCPAGPLDSDNDGGGVGEESNFFVSGSNNNVGAHVSTLSNTFINGANETAVTPVTFSAIAASELTTADKAQLTQVTYIGAVKDAADTWWSGWTCGIGGQGAC